MEVDVERVGQGLVGRDHRFHGDAIAVLGKRDQAVLYYQGVTWARLLLCVVCSLSAATASAKVQATFTVKSPDGELDFFAPELTRVFVAAAQKNGVDFGDATGLGVLESVGAGRVRLTITVRGRAVECEGRLVALDQLVEELVQKLRPAGELDAIAKQKRGQKPAPVAVADPPGAPRRLPDKAPDGKTETRPADDKAAAQPTGAQPDKQADKPPDKPADKPVVAVAAVAGGKPAESAHPTETPAVATPDRPIETPRPVDNPVSPKPDDKPAENVGYPAYGMVRSRVVAHAVVDIPSVYPTTGSLSTQALYFFLARRMRLTVVPTGVGVAPTSVVADEAWRAGAPAGIMARLLSVVVTPIPGGLTPEVRVQLEVVVVRDGREVWRRQLSSPPTVGASVRGRAVDPLYMAVLAALETSAADLTTLLR